MAVPDHSTTGSKSCNLENLYRKVLESKSLLLRWCYALTQTTFVPNCPSGKQLCFAIVSDYLSSRLLAEPFQR